MPKPNRHVHILSLTTHCDRAQEVFDRLMTDLEVCQRDSSVQFRLELLNQSVTILYKLAGARKTLVAIRENRYPNLNKIRDHNTHLKKIHDEVVTIRERYPLAGSATPSTYIRPLARKPTPTDHNTPLPAVPTPPPPPTLIPPAVPITVRKSPRIAPSFSISVGPFSASTKSVAPQACVETLDSPAAENGITLNPNLDLSRSDSLIPSAASPASRACNAQAAVISQNDAHSANTPEFAPTELLNEATSQNGSADQLKLGMDINQSLNSSRSDTLIPRAASLASRAALTPQPHTTTFHFADFLLSRLPKSLTTHTAYPARSNSPITYIREHNLDVLSTARVAPFFQELFTLAKIANFFANILGDFRDVFEPLLRLIDFVQNFNCDINAWIAANTFIPTYPPPTPDTS